MCNVRVRNEINSKAVRGGFGTERSGGRFGQSRACSCPLRPYSVRPDVSGVSAELFVDTQLANDGNSLSSSSFDMNNEPAQCSNSSNIWKRIISRKRTVSASHPNEAVGFFIPPCSERQPSH